MRLAEGVLRTAQVAEFQSESSASGVATALLIGLSIFASLTGSPSNAQLKRGAARELHTLDYDKVQQSTPPIPAPQVTCNIGAARYNGMAVFSGAVNIHETAESCRKSCLKLEACTSWMWCDDHQHCRDEHGGSIRYHGCHLMKEALIPRGIPSNTTEYQRRHMPRQQTVGFVRRRDEKQTTFLRMQSAPAVKMLISTYVPHAQCDANQGTQIAHMSILNKYDYAHWNNYMFRLETTTADSSLVPPGSPDEGSWNKVGILRKILAAYTEEQLEWILWMEPDAIFDDPSFTIPFEFYQGLDIITVADPRKAELGDPNAMSTGVMLLRNSRWTRQLLDELAAKAQQQSNSSRAESGAKRPADPVAAAMMSILRARGLKESLTHFRFEGEFCMSCDWRRIDLKMSTQVTRTTVWGEENKRWKLFITRFYDCETCWLAGVPLQNASACAASYKQHYEFAYCRFLRNALAIKREQSTTTFLNNLDENQIPSKGFNFTAFSKPKALKATSIAGSDDFRSKTAQECYEACALQKSCGSWIWCSHRKGCDDMGTFRGSFPYQGCQLSLHDLKSSPYLWNRGPQFSSLSSGYLSEDHPSKVGWAGRLARQVASPMDRIAFATGISTAPCSTPYGDLVVRLAIQNRQDYARLHSQEFHLMAQSVDPHLRMGAWQKLGFMQQLLREIPRSRAEWVVWVDMDIIIDKMGFEIPLSKYEGKDFVIWGREEKITQGDVLNGVNSGVFMMRNTDWSRGFLNAWVPFGSFPPDVSYDEMLRDKIQNFDVGMFEQNVIAYLVMQQPDLLDHIYFEGDYCFNCWYKDAFQSHIPQPPFIVHFAGCQVCTGFHPEKLNTCDRELVRTYIDSHHQLRSLVASKGKSNKAFRQQT